MCSPGDRRRDDLFLRNAGPIPRNEFFRFQEPVPDGCYEALIIGEVCVLKDDDLQVLLALNLIKKHIKVFPQLSALSVRTRRNDPRHFIGRVEGAAELIKNNEPWHRP